MRGLERILKVSSHKQYPITSNYLFPNWLNLLACSRSFLLPGREFFIPGLDSEYHVLQRFHYPGNNRTQLLSL